MRASENIEDFGKALAAAQAEMPAVKKDKVANAGAYSYTYADLEAVITAVRPILAKHGLSVVQETVSADSGAGVVTRLIHDSGQWVESGPLVLPAQGNAQQFGSAITYARRYSLAAALGIAAEEDDDGAQATKKASRETAGGDGSLPAAPPEPSDHRPLKDCSFKGGTCEVCGRTPRGAKEAAS